MEKDNEKLSFGRILLRFMAVLLLILIIWGCGAVPKIKEGSEASFVRLPFVRVLLAGASPEIVIGGETHYALECKKGSESVVYQASQTIKFRQENGLITVLTRRQKLGDKFDEVIVIPRGKKGFLSYKNRRYRGMFRILPRGMNLRLINVANMDDYLKGVVPPEIGFVGLPEFEAIKAQAVAARTYAMSRLSQYRDEPYDMKSDVTDQVYGGVEVEKNLVSKAIDETRGNVIKSEDKLINAYYHSTCGGYTDDIDEVWEKPAASYLRAVNDSAYCSWSKYFNWEETYSAKQLKLLLEQYLSSERGRVIKIGDILDIYVRSTTIGGRVSLLTVKTISGSYDFGKDRIRWVFKRASNPEMILQSARFKVETLNDSGGKLVRATFKGGGYGHGVGMCQCGAIGMARKGWKYREILNLYYKNSEVVKLY